MRRFLLAALALPLAFAGAACSKDDSTILIGEVGSMTGAEATFGQSTHKGILLAVDEVNARGGIRGKKLRVKALDDQGKPDEAASSIMALISRDKAVAIIGEVASTRSLAMAPRAQELKVPMISPSSTNEKVTKVGDYIFRVCFIDPFQGEVMAKFSRNSLKLGKVAILRDVRSDYSVGLAEAFTKSFKALGGEILADESYASNDVDFKAQLTSIKGRAPEAVFVPGYYSDVGLIARQARELGLTVPLLGGDGWDSAKLYEVGGSSLDNSYFSNHYSVDDTSPRVTAFVGAFKSKFKGEVPDSLAAQGYDAAMMLADAMLRAPDTTGPALRQALADTKNFAGVTGNISMDADRNAVKPAVVLKIAPGGRYLFEQRVEP